MRLFTVLAGLLLATQSLADELSGKVVSIADGDTITVLDAQKVQHKIRFQGIDAPEKRQAFGTRSKEALSEKIGERDFLVVWKEKDRYNRILGEVYFGKRNINLEMVQDGKTRHCKQTGKSRMSSATRLSHVVEGRRWTNALPGPNTSLRASTVNTSGSGCATNCAAMLLATSLGERVPDGVALSRGNTFCSQRI